MTASMITMLVLLLVLLFFGVPVPAAFFGSALFMIFSGGYDPSFLLPFAYSKASSYVLLAIPLYIIAGGIIERGNMGEKLINFIEMFVGHKKGSLGVVACVSCAVFGSITGSAAATQSVIGSIMWPRMNAAGYSRGKSAALIASSCLLGGLIPPSTLMILFAWSTQTSVLGCFLSTFIPGIIMTIMLSWKFVRMVQEDPDPDPDVMPELFKQKKNLRNLGKVTFISLPALMFPVIVIGGIYSGMMTPTEAAAVSAIYALFVGFFIYRGLTLEKLGQVLIESASTTGAIMFMLFMVMIISRIFTMEDLPSQILQIFTGLSDNRYVVLLLVNIFLILVGMLMDDCSATLLCGPLLMPTMLSIGVDPLHFAAILGVNISLGNVTPPCAPLLYLVSRLSKTPVNAMLKPTLQIILWVWMPLLALVTYIPALSLTLPRLIMGH